MGQNNSRRVSHDINRLPNTFRDDQLRRVIDDIDEENNSKGYLEVIKSGVFASEVILWSEPTNNPSVNPNAKKRIRWAFTRDVNGVFVEKIDKFVYDDDDDTVVVAQVTSTLTRDTNKTVIAVNTTITRP